VQTVAPIAVRDQIPIRGLGIMIEQIFNKVIWSTRYGTPGLFYSLDGYCYADYRCFAWFFIMVGAA